MITDGSGFGFTTKVPLSVRIPLQEKHIGNFVLWLRNIRKIMGANCEILTSSENKTSLQ
jgi:hypothetical protein